MFKYLTFIECNLRKVHLLLTTQLRLSLFRKKGFKGRTEEVIFSLNSKLLMHNYTNADNQVLDNFHSDS